MADGTRELDATALKALAHPLRVRIMQILGERDRASVTGLAAELEESTSAVSYHLRQLAEHGFVRADDGIADPPARRRGRPQSYWRRAVEQIHLSAFEFLTDDDTHDAAQLLLREYGADRSRRLAQWFESAGRWPERWQRASSDMDGTLRLSPAQTRALADELKAVVDRYRDVTPGRGARAVGVQYAVFPAGTAPKQ